MVTACYSFKKTRLMLILVYILLLSLLFLLTKFYHQSRAKEVDFGLIKFSKVLFVISHPDDECIFFSPTLRYLKNKHIEIHLLCLSSGNFYGLGDKRVKELNSSCENFGISCDRVYCIDRFKDNPLLSWDKKLIAQVVTEYVDEVGASAIFTFDGFGISGHLNHIATYKGARHLFENDTSDQLQVFTLETVHLLRKYIQVVDIIPSLVLSLLKKHENLVVSSPSDYYTGYCSMLCHRSQLVWYRRLVILFSRYMFMNSWISLKHDSKVN